MKNLKLLLCLALLAGCSSAGQMPPMAEFSMDIDQPYPPLTLLAKEPSSSLEQQCLEFDLPLFKGCSVQLAGEGPHQFELKHIHGALAQIGLFEQLAADASESHDYTASVALVIYDADEPLEAISGFLSGMSLGLVPIKTNRIFEAEIDLRWRDKLLKRYRLQLPVTYTARLYGHGTQYIQTVAAHLAAAFIRDYQLDAAHTAEFLLEKIGASDYVADLAHPEQVLGYRYKDRHVHHDPFMGARLRYQCPLAPDVVDMHIYPVKGARWNDATKALSAEMALLHREIRTMAKRGHYAKLRLPEQAAETQLPPASAQGEGPRGLKMDFSFTGPDGAETLSQLRLFLKKDKILKFTKTGPKGTVQQDLDEFAAAILPLLDPPEESVFMAEFRLELQRAATFTDD